MCTLDNDVTTRTRVGRNRETGSCNEGNTNEVGRPLNLFRGDTLSANGGSGLLPLEHDLSFKDAAAVLVPARCAALLEPSARVAFVAPSP